MGCCGDGGIIGTIMHGVKGVAKGAARIDAPPAEDLRVRRRLCLACEHAIPMPGNPGRKMLCSACPIPCSIYFKTANADEQCPLDPPKWKRSLIVIPQSNG